MKRLVAATLLPCSVFVSIAFAQTTNATLGGTVADATRALIPGVTITVTNTQTGIVNTVVTNETGAYQFASLQTGTYKVTAELPAEAGCSAQAPAPTAERRASAWVIDRNRSSPGEPTRVIRTRIRYGVLASLRR